LLWRGVEYEVFTPSETAIDPPFRQLIRNRGRSGK
jgi:hypothetical protein